MADPANFAMGYNLTKQAYFGFLWLKRRFAHSAEAY
jgi:hypothetical protein